MNDRITIDKAVSRTISLPQTVWDRLQVLADQRSGGNRSRYLSQLIAADMESGDIASAEKADNPLLECIIAFAPALQKDMKKWCERYEASSEHQPNQSRLIACLLEGLIDSADPEHASVTERWMTHPVGVVEQLERKAVFQGFESGYRWALIDMLRGEEGDSMHKLIDAFSKSIKSAVSKGYLEYEALPTLLKNNTNLFKQLLVEELGQSEGYYISFKALNEGMQTLSLGALESVMAYWEVLRFVTNENADESGAGIVLIEPQQIRAILMKLSERAREYYQKDLHAAKVYSYPSQPPHEKRQEVAEDTGPYGK